MKITSLKFRKGMIGISTLALIGIYLFLKGGIGSTDNRSKNLTPIKIRTLESAVATGTLQPISKANSLENRERALSLAHQFIVRNSEQFPIRKHHQLVAETFINPLGTRVRYQIFQNEIVVVGLNIDLQVGGSGKIKIISNNYNPIEKVEIDRRKWLTIEKILQTQKGSFIPTDLGFPSVSEPVIIWTAPYSSKGQLGYVVSVFDSKAKHKVSGQVVFSVNSGQLLARHIPRSEFN